MKRTRQQKAMILKAIDEFDECRTEFLQGICDALEEKVKSGKADELEKKMLFGTGEELLMTIRALGKMRQWVEAH